MTAMTMETATIDLGAAEKAHAEALSEWDAAVDLDKALAHPNTIDDERMAKLGLDDLVKLDAAGRREIDLVELDIRRARARLQRESAALRLSEARDALAAAKLAASTEALPAALDDHEKARVDLALELGELEEVWAEIIAHAWRVRDAYLRELSAANRLTEIAKAAAPNDVVREDVTVKRRLDMVPVELALEGPSRYAGRPECGIFGTSNAENDPRNELFWKRIGQVVELGRDRGLRRLGAMKRDKVERALSRIADVGNEQR